MIEKQQQKLVLLKECATHTFVQKTCADIIKECEKELLKDSTDEMKIMHDFMLQAFLTLFLHGGERAQEKIATEFHFKAVVDNAHEEEKATDFLNEQNILRMLKPIPFYNKIEAYLKK